MAQEIYHRSEWGNPNEQWGNVYLNADLTNELYKRASEYENSWVTDQLLNGVGTKPSIILTPTAYEDGLLNSVKPKGGENLLTYSEDFSQSNWQKYQISVDSNSIISPDGTQDASEITINSTTPSLGDTSLSLTVGNTYTLSCFVKKGTNRWVRLASVSSGSLGAWFDLENNVVGTVNSTSASIENYGNGWYRISNTITAISGTNQAFLGLSDADGGTNSTQVGNTVFAWGFQVERGSLGVYNPTNGTAIKNGDFSFTRGSSATRVNEKGLIQDVQILSDELVQNGNFEEEGSELVTNGSFDTDSDWTKGTGWSIDDGKAVAVLANNTFLQQNQTTVANKIYKVVYTISDYENGNVRFQFSGGGNTVGTTVSANGTYTEYITSALNHSIYRFRGTSADGGFTGSIDNVSVKEVGQNWSLEGGWSVQNGLLVNDGTGVNLSATQSGFFTVGNKYRVSLDIKSITQGSLEIYLGFPQSDVKTINSIGSYTYDIVASGNTTLYIKPLSNFIGSIDNISVIEITDDTDLPRINYTNFDYQNGEVVPYSGEGSLLLEPQRTNILQRSEQFDNSYWTKYDTSVSANQVVSPNGAVTADKLIEDTGTSTHIIGRVFNFTSGSYYAVSVFVKENGRNFQIKAGNTNTWRGSAIYNLSTGSVQSTTYGTATIENYGDGWYRCVLVGEALATASTNINFSLISGTSTTSYTGNGTSGVYIYGAQSEAASYATSYIPTEGSIKTRLQDICNNAGSSDLINSTEGVLYAEISALANDLTERRITISNSSNTSKLILIEYDTPSNTLHAFLYDGSFQAEFTHTLNDITTFVKVAFKFKENDFALWVDGFEVASDNSGSVFANNTLDVLKFENSVSLNKPFYGNVKCVAVFKEALSDEELQKLTQV